MQVMKTFWDYDEIRCVTIEDAKKAYPDLDWDKIESRFSWEMGGLGEVSVMSFHDLQYCIKLNENGYDFEDVEYTACTFCSVCDECILPDEEAYNDIFSDRILCDRHCRQDKDGNCHTIIF